MEFNVIKETMRTFTSFELEAVECTEIRSPSYKLSRLVVFCSWFVPQLLVINMKILLE